MCVPKDLTNCWTDLVLLYNEARHAIFDCKIFVKMSLLKKILSHLRAAFVQEQILFLQHTRRLDMVYTCSSFMKNFRLCLNINLCVFVCTSVFVCLVEKMKFIFQNWICKLKNNKFWFISHVKVRERKCKTCLYIYFYRAIHK